MKSNLTNVNHRRTFQLRVDENFTKNLEELANASGISASDVLRVLVNREHANQFNGHQPPAKDPCTDVPADGPAASPA